MPQPYDDLRRRMQSACLSYIHVSTIIIATACGGLSADTPIEFSIIAMMAELDILRFGDSSLFGVFLSIVIVGPHSRVRFYLKYYHKRQAKLLDRSNFSHTSVVTGFQLTIGVLLKPPNMNIETSKLRIKPVTTRSRSGL